MALKGTRLAGVIIVALIVVIGGSFVVFGGYTDALMDLLTGGGDDDGDGKVITNGTGDNDPPTAVIRINGQQGESFTFRVSEDIEFNGSASSDPDGEDDIVYYKWTFGDDSFTDNRSVVRNFSKQGTYNVTLTVTDDAGETGEDSVIIEIRPNDYEMSYQGIARQGIFINTFSSASFQFPVDPEATHANISITFIGVGAISTGETSATVEINVTNPEGVDVKTNTTNVMVQEIISINLESYELLVTGDWNIGVLCTSGTVTIQVNIVVGY